MRRRRRAAAAALVAIAAASTPAASQTPSRSPAPGHPVLERFTAQFDPTSGGTRYAAVAHDPDGGAVAYRWSLKAACGRLGNSAASGASNSYEHGPAVRKPDGCPNEAERVAVLTLTVADGEGCAVEYVRPAIGDGTQARPKTRALACDRPAPPESGGFPFWLVAVLAVLVAAVAGGFKRVQGRAAGGAGRPPAPPPAEASPQQAGPGEGSPNAGPVFEPFDGCPEGSVRNEATEVLAQESVAAGPVSIVAAGDGGTRRVDLGENEEPAIAELVVALGAAPGRALEVRADLTVRLVTAICDRRELCRGGRWVADRTATVREGTERVEVLRASVSSPEDLARFVDEVLAPRIGSLAGARRRLDAALERCRGAGG